MRNTRRPSAALVPAARALGALLGAESCAQPPVADTGSALVEIGDALNALRQEDALMQAQIDSLRDVVARQDTIITRLQAVVGGMPAGGTPR